MSCFVVFDVIDLVFQASRVVKWMKHIAGVESSGNKKQPKLLLGPSTTLALPVMIAHPLPSFQGQLTGTIEVSQAFPLPSQ